MSAWKRNGPKNILDTPFASLLLIFFLQHGTNFDLVVHSRLAPVMHVYHVRFAYS